MFTGLVQSVGEVRAVEPGPAGMRLTVAWPGPELALGESIAVNGCCLTVADKREAVFDVVRETLNRTTLGSLRPGSRVNLERSLRVGDLMGGHQVQGHIDGVGAVERVQPGGDWRVWIRPPRELMKYMVPKGSICMDGVSLTLAGVDVNTGEVQVALIPTTLELTTLGALKAGDRVNIEADAMAKTMVHYLEHYAHRLGSEQERRA